VSVTDSVGVILLNLQKIVVLDAPNNQGAYYFLSFLYFLIFFLGFSCIFLKFRGVPNSKVRDIAEVL
jgi:hypothetical protein